MINADASQSDFRQAYRSLVSYSADGPRAALHLADNTNAFGAPPAALAAVLAAISADLSYYPPSSGWQLCEAIAAYVGVAPNEVLIGCGADALIDCTLRALCEPGNSVAFPDPAFVMARHFAVTNGLRPYPVPIVAGGALDTAGLLNTNARIIYVCAPNNPTGIQWSREALRHILERAQGFVIVDEAYAEYSGETLAPVAASHGRLIVLRTFSKAFGLAGMRVGFAVAAPAILAELEKARGPFPVSQVALHAAHAAITAGLPWVRDRIAETIASREEFVRLLREHGFAPLPSGANFVLVPVGDAPSVQDALAQHGIGVRAFTALTGIGDALRITIGGQDDMRRVAHALVEATSWTR